MSDQALALQKAVFAELSSALSVPVYDAVPQDSNYPYVTYNATNVNNDDFLTERMDQLSISLNVWSRTLGQEEVLRIMGDIDDALHRARLSLDTGSLVSLRVTAKRTNREDDNETYMGQISLLAHIQH